MNLRIWLNAALLCVLISGWIRSIAAGVHDEDDEDKLASSRRRCRCKKYFAQINRDLNKRLDAFENKFENYFSSSGSNSDLNRNASKSEIQFNILTENMNETRNTLHKESVTLKRLQHRIQSQAVTIDNLNANFDALESIVNNLSRIVDKFEWTMRANLEARPVDAPIPPHLVVPTTQSPIYPRDCDEVYQSGGMRYLGDYYILVKPERSTTPFRALCKIMEGAGWTVIQRRHDGRENFTRDWEDYKHGFGDLQAEFWLGNENIHLLTTQDDYELRIVMEDWDGRRHHAEYDRFRVSGERSNFKLHVSGYHGNAGDSLTSFYHSHSGMEFSTYDRDNDRRLYDNCAEHYGSGWWYNDCYESHLNGKFYPHGSHDNFFIRDGILWNKIHQYASLKSTEMMIRPAPKAKLPNEI